METQDEVTYANTSAIFKNAWWQYRNYLKKTYFTGKETQQIPVRSPKAHLLDDDGECLGVYGSRSKNKCLNLKNNCSNLRFHCYHSSKKR